MVMALLQPRFGVPASRVRQEGAAQPVADGDFVLYWMIASRRLRDNFALQLAAGHARSLGKPLLVFEPLRAGYRWASDRLHRFMLDGMAANAKAARAAGCVYYPYIEPAPDEGKGLLEALAARACLVVTDEYPCFFLPRMVEAAADRLRVPLLIVDSNGLLPLTATPKAFTAAVHLRRFMQRELPAHLDVFPDADVFAGGLPDGALPAAIMRHWPPAGHDLLEGNADALAGLPIDHDVAPVAQRGGTAAAERVLRHFLDERLTRYEADRRNLDTPASSELSPYLHWGHISVHHVFRELARHEDWDASRVSARANGSKTGWWNMSADAEAFVDQLVTWRELGFNGCVHIPRYDTYASLPDWARATLADHADDPRPYTYDLETFENAATDDPLWNAAQRELRRDGRIHNYLRMLWGKKILEWSASPVEALETMVELNNRWAVDGRDPNSYAGIMWVLGRYDRGWPERAIYGKVRSMSSDATRRKGEMAGYLVKYGPSEDSRP